MTDFDSNHWIDEITRFVFMTNSFYKTHIETEFPTSGRKKLGTLETDVLELFSYYTELSVKEINQLLNLPNSTLTSVLNRLESQEYLERKISLHDKRTYLVIPTSKGHDFINLRHLEKRKLYQYLIDSIATDTHPQEIMNLIKKMSAAIENVNYERLRRIHMDIIKKEYNEFGPWIAMINDSTELPPQFEHESDLILNADYAFKIPRQIERRNAKPGMPLYDQVVAYYSDQLILFDRSETNTIKKTHIQLSDILMIQSLQELLFGELIITTQEDSHSIVYNPVSHEIIEKLVTDIRKTYYDKPEKFNIEALDEHVKIHSPIFKTILLTELTTDDVKLIEYQPFIELVRQKTNAFTFFTDLISKPVLQDSMFLTNGKELIILSRVQEVKSEKDADYGYRKTFIPLDYIKDFSTQPDVTMENLYTLDIKLQNAYFQTKISNDVDVSRLSALINTH